MTPDDMVLVVRKLRFLAGLGRERAGKMDAGSEGRREIEREAADLEWIAADIEQHVAGAANNNRETDR